MNSNERPIGVMAAYIIEESPVGILVKCPFCHEEHTHPETGVYWATCRVGSYTTIKRGSGKSTGPTQRFG